jgi:phenylacetate-CoA ligase
MVRALREWIRVRDVFRIMRHGGRMTLICATGGHYAEAVAGARLQHQRGEARVQVLAAHAPLPKMIEKLNAFQPDVLAPYASIAAPLAGEQTAGRLRISPTLIVLSAEGLPEDGYDRIRQAFKVPVHHSYAATECPFISYSCEQDWLHVNGDWVILEPVDAEYRPVPAGTQSQTVLVSNLANRVQPILRYDLSDRIVVRPDPCPCGNPLRAIRVEARTGDVLTFSIKEGGDVHIPALMFEVVDAVDVELFQIVQTAPDAMRVRLRLAAAADPNRVWQSVQTEIRRVLDQHGLAHVRVERADEPPEQAAGGKYRTVVPLQ